MRKEIRIAPSILSADFAKLGEDIAKVEPYTDILHLDVMDGHFVPNITFGPPLVKSIRKVTKKLLDVHLMISEPDKYIEPFAKAGADNLTFHIEIVKDPAKMVKEIRELGCRASVSLNPDTPAESLAPIIDIVDMVLVMTVQPGFGGQSFRSEVLPKIKQIRRMGDNFSLEVDGGINTETIVDVVKAGGDTIVAGTAVFGESSPGEAVMRLKEIANNAQSNR